MGLLFDVARNNLCTHLGHVHRTDEGSRQVLQVALALKADANNLLVVYDDTTATPFRCNRPLAD